METIDLISNKKMADIATFLFPSQGVGEGSFTGYTEIFSNNKRCIYAVI